MTVSFRDWTSYCLALLRVVEDNAENGTHGDTNDDAQACVGESNSKRKPRLAHLREKGERDRELLSLLQADAHSAELTRAASLPGRKPSLPVTNNLWQTYSLYKETHSIIKFILYKP